MTNRKVNFTQTINLDAERILLFTALLGVGIFMTDPALAIDFNAQAAKVKNLLTNQIIPVIQSFATTLGVIYLISCVYKDIFTENGPGMRGSRYVLMISGIALIWLAPQLVEYVRTVIVGGGVNGGNGGAAQPLIQLGV